jgi:hypothetical protein
LFLGVLALFAGNIWWTAGGFLAPLFAVLLVGGAVICTLNALSSEPAIKFDRDSLWVRTALGGVKQIPWREVHQIALEVLTLRYFGVIPVSRTETLCIACEGGVFGARRLRVAASALALPAGGAAELVLILQQGHVEAVGVAGVAMAGAGSRGWGIEPAAAAVDHSQSEFDPDAAVARYLASKQAGAEATPAPEVHQPPIPQRPLFGRKVS